MRHPLDIARRPIVLVVDDTPQNLTFVSSLLESECTVKVAPSGERALKSVAATPSPDLILLDLMMPGMDGYEVCRRLKEDPHSRDIPIIFLTASQEEADEQRGLEMGAVDFISKPISPPILLARVKTQLALKAAADRQRDFYRFVSDSLDHVPDATLVCDRAGAVLIANKAAARHFATADLRGGDLVALMRNIRSSSSPHPIVSSEILDAEPSVIKDEAFDPEGRNLLVRCVPSFAADDVHTGWILSLTDLTQMRETQRQRDEALRFLSHDLREPQSSILALLEMRNEQALDLSTPELLLRIQRHANRALHLAESFVQVSRAESTDYRLARTDLVELLEQAADDAWSLARERGAEIVVSPVARRAFCMIDRELVLRAVSNLMGNALKYSPAGGKVWCEIAVRGRHWRISVRDEGPGIAPGLQASLFQPYNRLHAHSHPQAKGIGLGLTYVRAVAQRHGGSVELQSEPGQGCTFGLLLPRGRGKPVQGRSRIS